MKPLSIWGEKPLNGALASLLRPLLGEKERLLITLTGEWKMIVGEEVAGYTQPQSMNITKTERTLTLAVVPGMNTLVAHQEPELLERIGQYIGQGKVTRIKIISKTS